MMKDSEGHLDPIDRLDELENHFEMVAGRPLTKDIDKIAKAQALALLSLAIDSVHEAIQETARQEESESSALKTHISN